MVTDLDPLQTVVLSIVLGGTIAGTVHLAKAKVRLLSTTTSAGLGNPVLSTLEDAGALVGSIGATLVPLLVLLVLVAGAILLWLALRRLRPGAAEVV